MRDIISWKRELKKQLASSWGGTDLSTSRICDIELGLFLWEWVSPEESVDNLWVLLSGYSFKAPVFQEMNADMQRAISTARFYLKYYKSKQVWAEYIDRYRKVDQIVRLYDIDNDHILIRRHPSICSNRDSIYQQTLLQNPGYAVNKCDWAKPGKVYFISDRKIESYTLPEKWREALKESDKHKLLLPDKKVREPITVTMDELIHTAEWMDRSLNDSKWQSIIKRIKLKVPLGEGGLQNSDCINLNGIYHIAGMVSSGKSILMKVLAVWAARNNFQITLVVDSVTAVMELWELMWRLGIKAAPLLGSVNKDAQLMKMHMVTHCDSLFDLSDKAPFHMLSVICPLNGLRTDTSINRPFKPGNEPCRNLYEKNPQEEKSSAKCCPFYYKCPVQKPNLALADASVYIATPASLIFTWVPGQICSKGMRMFEMVNKCSDIIIFDEADRVQVILDEYFSPSQILADGKAESWLNRLGSAVESAYYQNGRSQLTNPDAQSWKIAYRSVQNAVDQMYSMLIMNDDLVKWAANEHFSAQWLISKFINDVKIDNESTKDQLEKDFLVFKNDPMGEGQNHVLCDVWSSIISRTNNTQAFDLIVKWLDGYGISKEQGYVERIAFIVITAVLEKNLLRMINEWEDAGDAYGLDSKDLSFFKNHLTDYLPIIPESPMGNHFGFKFYDEKKGNPGRLDVFKYLGIGRWILSNFPYIFSFSDGVQGPHTILLSGTSWAPGSSSYHVRIPVSAVLQAPEREFINIDKSEFSFKPAYFKNEPIKISGSDPKDRIRNIRRMVDYLLEDGTDISNHGLSILEAELDRLGMEQKQLLILTGSYEETDEVHKYLASKMEQKGTLKSGDIYKLIRDVEAVEQEDDSVIHRGEVDTFAARGAKILIAPLLAIERGHNILNDEGVAALGSAFFLVRPMPVPQDMMGSTLFINHWAMGKILHPEWIDTSNLREIGEIGNRFRRSANGVWRARMNSLFTRKGGTRTLNQKELEDLYWTKLVLIWQVIGRLIRGGQSARAYFIDAAFAPNTASGTGEDNEKTSMLIGIQKLLAPYFDVESDINRSEKEIAQALYGPFYKAISNVKGM